MPQHLDELTRKIARLREAGAEAEMERRWEADEELEDLYPESPLSLPEGLSLGAGSGYPEGLERFYSLVDGPVLGSLRFKSGPRFGGNRPLILSNGRLADERHRINVGMAGDEEEILVDTETGRTMIYFYNYGKYGWDSGVNVECGDFLEFADTVAFGPRYREIFGPLDRQRKPWWEEDPWYALLVESGMAGPSAE